MDKPIRVVTDSSSDLTPEIQQAYDIPVVPLNVHFGTTSFPDGELTLKGVTREATLDVTFNGGAQITAWYLGIYEANYTPAADDTAANIAGRCTESTAYDETTREVLTIAAPAGNAITNSANRAVFTMNATKTIYGCILASASAKQSALGTLMSTTLFTNARAVIAGDELLVTYTLTAADA